MSTLIRSPAALGNAVQRARKARGLSQADLGALAGLRQSAISMVEKGHAPLKLDILLKLLAVLDLDLTIGPRAKGSIDDFAGML
jgi:HTH-type transcriptional regulator / antitoxin HipB